MRRRSPLLRPCLPLLLLAACVEGGIPIEPSPPAFAISDAVHGGGNSHFFWLPPMVGHPGSVNGDFDAGQAPTVVIRSPDGPTIAEYRMTSGLSSERVRVDPVEEHYLVNWPTGTLPPGATYRIEVRVAGTLLGVVDVRLGMTGQDARNLTTNETIKLAAGRTLPIKFRIEQGAVFVVSPEAGGTVDALGGAVTLAIPPGALAQQTGITVEAAPATGGALAVVVFGPSGLQFAQPVPITIAYNPAALPPGLAETDLALNIKDALGRWIVMPGSSVDPVTKTVTAPFHHFSEGGVGPAELAIFCSGDGNPDTFEVIEGALDAVMSAGTVEVCTGTHAVEGVLLDRPVTVRGAAGGNAVLETATAFETFLVEGISSGSVILDGLTFNMTTPFGAQLSYAIRTSPGSGGTYDQLVIRNSTFNIASHSRGSVQPGPSTVAGALVTVENVIMTGGVFGIAGVGANLEVTNLTTHGTTQRGISNFAGGGVRPWVLVQASSFSDCGRACILLNSSDGVVRTSTFDSCAVVACIWAAGSTDLVATSNVFTSPVPAPVGWRDVAQIQDFATALIQDNDFLDCSPRTCIHLAINAVADVLANRFTLSAAGRAGASDSHAVIGTVNFGPPNVTLRVMNNQITGCWVHCIRAAQRTAATVTGNTITIPAGFPQVASAISGDGVAGTPGTAPENAPTLVAEDNVIDALGEIADPTAASSYPLASGIHLINTVATSIARNTVRRAAAGIVALEESNVQSGRDNVIMSSVWAVQTTLYDAGNPSPGLGDGRAALRFNDFTDYIHSIWVRPGDAASDLTCNFWGGGTGEPLSPVNAGTSPAIFTPWATAPIAGTGAVGCP